jgi:hypothetical protein
MKSVACCFLLVSAGLCAQSTAKLDSDLMSLGKLGVSRNAVAQQLTNDILALAAKDAMPSRQTVLDFANELTKAFLSRAGTPVILFPQRKPPTLQAVTQPILDVLQSSGASSSRFHEAIDRFRTALTWFRASAAQAKSAADRLFILGQEVRGPEDIRLNSL